MPGHGIGNTSVRLVAIAKDEAPYISDWVFHHLWFGFNSIHVYLNRTSDATAGILENIGKQYSNVTYEYIDWVDWVGEKNVSQRMQEIAYSVALADARSKELCDYLFCLDIDEFWMPKNMRSSVGDCLSVLNYPDMISFEWQNLLGEGKEFSVFDINMPLWKTGQVKSLFRIKAEVNQIRIHVPVLGSDSHHVIADGAEFSPDPEYPERLENSLRYEKDFFVLHRMFRSQREYLATLMRGRPGQRMSIKLNRPGFIRPNDKHKRITLDSVRYESYVSELHSFYHDCGLVDLIELSRAQCRHRSDSFLEAFPAIYLSNPKKIESVIRGVDLPKLNEQIDSLREVADQAEKQIERQKVSDVDYLRNLAFSLASHGQMVNAYYVMCKAGALRPNGIVIQRAIKEYEPQVIRSFNGGS